MTDDILSKCRIAHLPVLTTDEIEDARFRGADRGWAALADLFDKYAEGENLSYAMVARRIDRPRSQVQRWMQGPYNMTLQSLGLLTEALDADLEVRVIPRCVNDRTNYHHPCEGFFVHTGFNELGGAAVLAKKALPKAKTQSRTTGCTVTTEWRERAE